MIAEPPMRPPIIDRVAIGDLLRRAGRRYGAYPATREGGRATSFAKLDRAANRVANALIALGVKPHERIAYLGKNSDIYFELLMGAMKANVVMAPVNWRLAGPEVVFIVDDCKAPVLFVGPLAPGGSAEADRAVSGSGNGSTLEHDTAPSSNSVPNPAARSVLTTFIGSPHPPFEVARGP